MPQKGQKTVTLSESKIPKRLTILTEEFDQSFASLVTYCIWKEFGNPQQQMKAKKVLRLFS